MTATTAVSISWFYSCTSRRHLLSIPVLKFTSPRFPLSSAIYHFTDQLSVAYVQNRRNLLKITAAMTQGEVETETEVAQADAMARLQNTKLYFGNLPYNCDSEQLAGVIQEHASPEMIEVLYDKETGRSRGFAVVTMSSIQDCEAVISKLNGFVEYISFPYMCLFVSCNLCWSVTSEALKQVFKDYGNLVSARVIYDGETGRSRGFGFVCFSTKEEMDSAMESLNGVELEGRALRISLALGKKT
ncbi:hypothetical protein IEQ34_013969 [Dendrobium chrysotoxum]|uniref:RRM domain-containing protein n=1 Tax=Dendrobium chrysotoxum TaxID=161865 RepID=A0AAV7GKR1_DENCH|nr:hypothetical protein IEQ34_013969 [Dendrobium chrysotoxum]